MGKRIAHDRDMMTIFETTLTQTGHTLFFSAFLTTFAVLMFSTYTCGMSRGRSSPLEGIFLLDLNHIDLIHNNTIHVALSCFLLLLSQSVQFSCDFRTRTCVSNTQLAIIDESSVQYNQINMAPPPQQQQPQSQSQSQSHSHSQSQTSQPSKKSTRPPHPPPHSYSYSYSRTISATKNPETIPIADEDITFKGQPLSALYEQSRSSYRHSASSTSSNSSISAWKWEEAERGRKREGR